ncbi:hypothetical protein HDA40_002624 [Hamadaea flava]|uniref:Secreted protein n=1 Tax=Hamadaea flava TaxID=1742688 RepID=A0ABV8LMJ1_9ACTN|nr:hypothetical protein [Hamadaea flava]MCP2324117.1 hypothetical protein [Hamadaea flava]
MKLDARKKIRAGVLGAAIALGTLVAISPASPAAAATYCTLKVETRAADWTAQSGWAWYTNCSSITRKVRTKNSGGTYSSCQLLTPYATYRWDWIAILGIGYPQSMVTC